MQNNKRAEKYHSEQNFGFPRCLPGQVLKMYEGVKCLISSRCACISKELYHENGIQCSNSPLLEKKLHRPAPKDNICRLCFGAGLCVFFQQGPQVMETEIRTRTNKGHITTQSGVHAVIMLQGF